MACNATEFVYAMQRCFVHVVPADTGADMEPFFPMPIRTSRVSVALPGRERSVRQRATAVDPFVASLPDPKKMTDKVRMTANHHTLCLDSAT